MNHKAGLKKELFTKGVTKQSVYFVGVNRNKKSLTCNLKTSQGLAIAKELVKTSDILIENVRSGLLCSAILWADSVNSKSLAS